MLFPTVEARHVARAQQVADDEPGSLFQGRVEVAATRDVVGQCPQPKPVAVGLEVGPRFRCLWLLLAREGETGGHHDRTVDRVGADRRKGLVDAMLVSEQGCGHPVMPRRGGGGAAGPVQRVRAPGAVTQPSVLVELVDGAGRDRSLRCLGAGQQVDAALDGECRSVGHKR